MPSEKKAVLTAEGKRIHNYDLVFIINPELPDDAVETAVNNVSQFITGKGGTIVNTEKWGKKKLAYPLRHFLEGYYVFIKFKMETTWSKELETSLQISENILRHLLIKVGE
ncbi:MAG: 30S ribosomal protein S6 [Dehalococcoidales bacterium]|nr:30S ribosomal protein S6 [Dehalococcoidales bacterium]